MRRRPAATPSHGVIMNKHASPALALLLTAALVPVASHAADCAGSSTLAGVIAQGTCTLGDLTLDFTEPHLGTTYLPGPFAGDTMLGPSASAVSFSVDTSDPDHVSFTLGLALQATGSSGGFKPGNYVDIDLSYIKVYSTATRGLSGYAVNLVNPEVQNLPTSDTYSAAGASLNGAYDFITPNGTASSGPSTVDPPVVDGLKYFDLSARAYNYSSDPSTSIGFDGVKVTFDVSSVPEPGSLALGALGLAAVAGARRRRTRAR
jgi:MYXO-CTERM domain-containing protein